MSDKENNLLKFPCDFAIKAMGLANDEFETAVLAIVHKNFQKLSETAIKTRPSKDGKYLAITITVSANSKEQLDKVYQELTANTHVIMAL